MLTIMIDLSNKIRKLADSLSLTINEDSMIFRFQKKILKLSLNNEEFTQ
jgi:rRNA maturation protein Rpf1